MTPGRCEMSAGNNNVHGKNCEKTHIEVWFLSKLNLEWESIICMYTFVTDTMNPQKVENSQSPIKQFNFNNIFREWCLARHYRWLGVLCMHCWNELHLHILAIPVSTRGQQVSTHPGQLWKAWMKYTSLFKVGHPWCITAFSWRNYIVNMILWYHLQDLLVILVTPLWLLR